MLDLQRHADCPLWDALASPVVPWPGMRYACVKVLHAYCKVFNKQELYDLIVRKTCQECKCPRETHAVYHEQLTTVRERLGFKHDTNTSRVDPRQMGYTWVPPGILTSAKIQRYFDVIPPEKVPKIGTQGERFRDKQLVYQLPKQDLALDYCKHVEEQNRGSYEDFVAARNEIALDIGYVKDTPQATKCTGCCEALNQGEMAVTAPKFREQTLWHPRCFKCTSCDELLVDLTYCVHDDQIYCERHYAEMLKPRCSACDEVGATLHTIDMFRSRRETDSFHHITARVSRALLIIRSIAS
uniref:LIM zinc-binding domain-containing protein n=1 Tax=Anopheles dirus TaxID=7168 RepID=A0A182NH09_9DIPT